MNVTTNKILILFAHPVFHRSHVNKALVAAAGKLNNVTLHDLYHAYPDLDIDIDYEQQLLIEHDIIIFHFPFYWYSSPAIIKEWQDLVLVHGWAYGHAEGAALKGKKFMLTITTGGTEQAYTAEGHNHFTLMNFLAPFIGMSQLCEMKFIPPFVVHGTHLLNEDEIEEYALDYKKILKQLRDNQIDLNAFKNKTKINHSIERDL